MFKIGNKIVEAFCSKRVVSENKTIHTPHLLPRSTQSWGVCCFIQVVQTAVQHCMEGIGEEKLYFLLFRSVKRQERPLGQSVLTNFVTDYLYLYLCLCLCIFMSTSKCICIFYITICMIIEPMIGNESTAYLHVVMEN